MTKLSDIPCWYYDIAIVVSAYQAYRGFMFQWIFGIDTKAGKARKVFLLCLADMFTYFLCAFSGFLALFFAYELISASPAPATTALIIIFLALYGVLGITAKLPDLLPKLKFP
jgi:hypothetical protein